MSLLSNSVTSKPLWNFDPRNLPDCVLWLDAADTRTITGTNPVTAWSNKGTAGGSATNTTGSFTSGISTENGLNYITSPAGTEMRFTATLPSQARSWFFVARLLTQLNLSSGSNPRFWSPINTTSGTAGQDSTVGYRQTATGYAMQIGPGGIAVTLGSTSLPSPLNVIGVYALVNSSTTTANNVVTFNGTSYTLSSNALASSFLVNSQTYSINRSSYATGFEIFEIIHYAREVSMVERKTVEAYLMWKWGITKINEFNFIPTSISNCALWYDSDVDFNDATSRSTCFTFSSGNSVDSWLDKSGNNRHAAFYNVSPSTVRPVLTQNQIAGKPALIFNGTNALSNGFSLGSTQSHTVFAVAAPAASGFRAVLSFNCINTSRGALITIYQSGSNFWWYSGGSVGTDGTTASINLATGRYDILAFYWDPGLRTLMNINGHAIQSSTGSPASLRATATMLIGATTSAGTAPVELWSGGMAEIIVYTSILTAAQRNVVERYLSLKWNRPLVNAGALTHPNRILPPFQRPFYPMDINGCVLWIDGADRSTVTADGSNGVTGITDKLTGEAYTVSSNWTYDIPSNFYPLWYRFRNASGNVGASLAKNTTFVLAQPMTFFIYGQHNSTASGAKCYIDFNSTTRFSSAGTSTVTVTLNFGTALSFTGSSAVRLYSCVVNGASSEIYQDGSLVASGNAGTNGFTAGISIGSFFTGNTTANAVSQIGEVIIYNSRLSTSDRKKVERYLADKWTRRSTYPEALFTLSNSPQILPTTFADIALWLDAADPDADGIQPASGTAIRQWVDKSGNNKTVYQTTAALCPVFSYDDIYPVIDCTNGGKYFQGPSGTHTSRTYGLFVVAKNGGLNANVVEFLKTGGTGNTVNRIYIKVSNSVIDFREFYENAYNIFNNTSVGGNNRHIMTISSDGILTTPSKFYFDGTSLSNITGGSGTNTTLSTSDNYGFLIGGQWDNQATTPTVGSGFSGYIYEVILMLHQPTTQERQMIEGYLAWKWGIEGSLPSTHPYKKVRT